MRKKTKILGIGAHPADIIGGAGGTIVNHLSQGDEVSIISLTNGALSHGGLIYKQVVGDAKIITREMVDKVVELKRKEAYAACEVLGVKNMIFMGYDDEPLCLDREKVLTLALKIREIQPDIVITHYPNENDHDDHRVVGELALRAIKAASNVIMDTNLPAFRVDSVYYFLPEYRYKFVSSGYQMPLATILVGVKDTIEKKKEAVMCFQSQKYNRPWVDKIFERVNGLPAIMEGYDYVEEFVAIRPLAAKTLPTSGITIYDMKNDIYSDGTKT